MDEDEQLRSVVEWKRKPRRDRTVRLGDTLNQLLERRITPQQIRFAPIARLWRQLLPAELSSRCEIIDLSGGQLTVRVESPSVKFELQLCGPKLLEQLQKQCPRARVKRIRFVLG